MSDDITSASVPPDEQQDDSSGSEDQNDNVIIKELPEDVASSAAAALKVRARGRFMKKKAMFVQREDEERSSVTKKPPTSSSPPLRANTLIASPDDAQSIALTADSVAGASARSQDRGTNSTRDEASLATDSLRDAASSRGAVVSIDERPRLPVSESAIDLNRSLAEAVPISLAQVSSGHSMPTLHMLSTMSLNSNQANRMADTQDRLSHSMGEPRFHIPSNAGGVIGMGDAGGVLGEPILPTSLIGGDSPTRIGGSTSTSAINAGGTAVAVAVPAGRIAHTEKLSAIIKKSEVLKKPNEELLRRRAAAHRSMDLLASRAIARKTRDALEEIALAPGAPEPQQGSQRPISIIGQPVTSRMVASASPEPIIPDNQSVRFSLLRSGSGGEAMFSKFRKASPVASGPSGSQPVDSGPSGGSSGGSPSGPPAGASGGNTGANEEAGSRRSPGSDYPSTSLSSIPASFASVNMNSLRKSRISMISPQMAVSLQQPAPQQPQKTSTNARTFKEWYVGILNESDAVVAKHVSEKDEPPETIELHQIFGFKRQDLNPIDRLMWAAKEYDTLRRTPQWLNREDKSTPDDEVHDDMAVRLVDIMPEGRISGLVYDDAINPGDIDILVSGIRKDLLDGLIFPLDQDLSYAEVFFASYRFFMPSQDVLDCLIGWYNADTETNQTEASIEAFLRKYRKQIQTRAVRMLLAWIRNHWHDFHNDPVLYGDLTLFVDYLSKVSFANHQKLTQAIREQRLTWYTYQYISMFPVTRPALTESTKPWIGEWEVEDLAQNLTMIDHLYFRQIKPDMYLQLMHKPAPFRGGGYNVPLKIVMEHCLWFRTLVAYTATVVAKEDNLKKKTNYIKRFIKVAKACKDMSNYNTTFALIYGLKRPAVLMWTHAWEMLPAKYMEQFKELDLLIDPAGGFANYIDEMKMAQPPAVPFILPYVQHIIDAQRSVPSFLDEFGEVVGVASSSNEQPGGLPSTTESMIGRPSTSTLIPLNSTSSPNQRINFQKYYHLYSIAAELEVFRLSSYHGILKGDRESNLLLVNHIRNYAQLDDKALGEGLLFSSSSAKSGWNETAAGAQGNKAMKRATMLFSATAPGGSKE